MNKRILSLCAQAKRDIVKRAVAGDFKVSFISVLSEVSNAINEFKPDLFIHDWQAQEDTQARQFHLKFGQSTAAINLARIVLVPEVTPQLLAFASDAMIERFHTYSAVPLNLLTEAKMLLDGREGNELQKFLRESKLPTFNYNQQAIDQKIEQLYGNFAHDPKVKMEYASLLLRQGESQKAMAMAQDIITKDPMNLRANNLVARAKMKLGQFDEALIVLNRANVLSPSNPARLILLADAFFGKGDLDAALANYQAASHLDSDYEKEAGRQIGRIKLAQGDLEEAVDFFKSSVSEEESAGFFNNAAVQAAKSQQFKEALKLYESALKTLKTDRLKPVIYYNIALSHWRLAEHEPAMKALKRSLNYDPQHEKALALMQKLSGAKAS